MTTDTIESPAPPLAGSGPPDDLQRAVQPITQTFASAALAVGADAAMRRLSPTSQQRLTAMPPLAYLAEVLVPLLVILHAALAGRPGVRYTELGFQHLSSYGMAPLRLMRERAKFYRAIYPVFRCAATRGNLAAASR